MRERRFIGDLRLERGEQKIFASELLHQVRDVLRLSPEAVITLSDGRGTEAKARIIAVTREYLHVDIFEVSRDSGSGGPHVVLYAAILKRENFELVVQKATEIGVAEIIPLVSARTVKLNIRPERLLKIAREAAEQSGRAIVPRIRGEMSFAEACREAKERSLNVWMCDGEGAVPALEARADGEIAVFVGPEGGWTGEEKDIARANGFGEVLLSDATLRGETAAIAASFLAVSRAAEHMKRT